MTRPYPIPGLTRAQRRTFEQIAIGQDQGHNPKTLQVLLDKGAIVPVADKVLGQDRFGVIAIPQYEVPIPVHAAWCAWCAVEEL